MKARVVALGNREVPGRDFNPLALGMHHPSQASKGAFFQKATALQVKPRSDDIVTAYLKATLDLSKKPRVLANPHGITGRNGVGVIVATELYGTHTSGPAFCAARRANETTCG